MLLGVLLVMAAYVGKVYVVDVYDCDRSHIDSQDAVVRSLEAAVAAGNATLVHTMAHSFSPSGVTAVALLKESHASIHTWPEHAYVAIDVFTCGSSAQPAVIVDVLARAFGGRARVRWLTHDRVRGGDRADVEVYEYLVHPALHTVVPVVHGADVVVVARDGEQGRALEAEVRRYGSRVRSVRRLVPPAVLVGDKAVDVLLVAAAEALPIATVARAVRYAAALVVEGGDDALVDAVEEARMVFSWVEPLLLEHGDGKFVIVAGHGRVLVDRRVVGAYCALWEDELASFDAERYAAMQTLPKRLRRRLDYF